MIQKRPTLEEIRRQGLQALHERLGLAGMSRFLRIYNSGSGDYTKERQELLKDETIDEIMSRIEKRRAAKSGRSPIGKRADSPVRSVPTSRAKAAAPARKMATKA